MYKSVILASALAVLTSVGPAVADQKVTRAAQTFMKVCAAGYPDPAKMIALAKRSGLSDRGSHKYAGDGFWITIETGSARPGSSACTMFMAGRVKRADLSDALQSQLGAVSLTNLKASRRGQRLEATFTRGGAKGRISTEALGGVSSAATVWSVR